MFNGELFQTDGFALQLSKPPCLRHQCKCKERSLVGTALVGDWRIG